ncbi:MAG: M48 family metalloprotease [Candidatus Competibacter sp.]
MSGGAADGHVVLSRQAVAIIHGQAPVDEIEARLAFVLGHELAHLANEDFAHREIFAFQTERAGTEDLAGLFQKADQAKARELEADDRGCGEGALSSAKLHSLRESSRRLMRR